MTWQAHTNASDVAEAARKHAVGGARTVCRTLVGKLRRRVCTRGSTPEHVRRILVKYATYYHEMRTHLSLGIDAPCTRPIERFGDIVTHQILGGAPPSICSNLVFRSDKGAQAAFDASRGRCPRQPARLQAGARQGQAHVKPVLIDRASSVFVAVLPWNSSPLPYDISDHSTAATRRSASAALRRPDSLGVGSPGFGSAP
jgi:hypothetical protein